jgi:hypothetical protein
MFEQQDAIDTEPISERPITLVAKPAMSFRPALDLKPSRAYASNP